MLPARRGTGWIRRFTKADADCPWKLLSTPSCQPLRCAQSSGRSSALDRQDLAITTISLGTANAPPAILAPSPKPLGETWMAVHKALRSGRRGLPAGSPLAKLLGEKRRGWLGPQKA